MSMELKISELKKEEIPEFCSLVRTVYDEFVAPDYSDEGNSHFYSYLEEAAVSERFEQGGFFAAARVEDIFAGVAAFRDISHLTTFFVSKDYQNRGVGRMLFAFSLRHIRSHHPEIKKITVNSSPFALPVYKRLGFELTGGREEKDGIIYYPMEYRISR